MNKQKTVEHFVLYKNYCTVSVFFIFMYVCCLFSFERRPKPENAGWCKRPESWEYRGPSVYFKPWCNMPNTFGIISPGHAHELKLHERNECSGRDFVAEQKWMSENRMMSLKEFREKCKE